MEERKGVYYYEEDEIDLYELWLTLKKRVKTIVIVTIAFVATSAIYCITAPDVYRIETVVSLPQSQSQEQVIVSYPITKDIIEKLEKLIQNKEYRKLANLLQISQENLKGLKKIEAESYRKDSRFFKLIIESTNKGNLNEIKNGTLKYLNNNEFVLRKIKENREIIKNKINYLKSQLLKLKKTATKLKALIIKTKKAKIVGFNPLDIDKSIIDLKMRINDLELILSSKVHGYEEVSSNLSPNPVKPKRKLIITVSLISGLFLGIFIAFFQEWLETERNKRRNETSPQFQ